MKRVLVVPDSMWGNDSGHRSGQFLVKTLKKQGFEVRVYAEDNKNYSSQKNSFIKSEKISFFHKTPYSFLDQFFPRKSRSINEFKKVINQFGPDLVFYFGTIRNKVSIDYLLSINDKIPYIYLPLTNEFWCLKNFAGLKEGECFKCMGQNFTHSFINRCLETSSPIPYLKGAIERLYSKRRFLNSRLVLGYSHSQRQTFEMYGLPRVKAVPSNIFFEPKSLDGIKSMKGDFFLISGQISDAKGAHLVPKLIKLSSIDIKFKFIIYNKEVASNFIENHNLQNYIDSGKLEVISGLESHKEVLAYVATSLGVIIPSNYPSTGEFALLEAMGLEKPILAFDVGAHKDFLVDHENSLISSAQDVNKMIKDLEKLSNDEDLWRSLSINARLTFEKITSFDKDNSLIDSINL